MNDATPPYWPEACRALAENDPVMAGLIRRYKGEFLRSRGDAFYSLARSIVGQQVSVAAADTIWKRFERAAGRVAPKSVHVLKEDALRAAGLSRQKVAYMKDLARGFLEGAVVPELFAGKADHEVIGDLTKIKGVGRWTAEMFLIFHLTRPDVFPIADLGLQKAITKHYGFDSKGAMLDHAGRRWQPWRTVATWYLWRSLDPMPVEY